MGFPDSGQFSLEEVLMIKVSIKAHAKFCQIYLLGQLTDGWKELQPEVEIICKNQTK